MATRSAILRTLRHVVGDRERGGAEVGDAGADQVVDHVGHDRIEAGGRLVEEHDLRLRWRWPGRGRPASACRPTARPARDRPLRRRARPWPGSRSPCSRASGRGSYRWSPAGRRRRSPRPAGCRTRRHPGTACRTCCVIARRACGSAGRRPPRRRSRSSRDRARAGRGCISAAPTCRCRSRRSPPPICRRRTSRSRPSQDALGAEALGTGPRIADLGPARCWHLAHRLKNISVTT